MEEIKITELQQNKMKDPFIEGIPEIDELNKLLSAMGFGDISKTIEATETASEPEMLPEPDTEPMEFPESVTAGTAEQGHDPTERIRTVAERIRLERKKREYSTEQIDERYTMTHGGEER